MKPPLMSTEIGGAVTHIINVEGGRDDWKTSMSFCMFSLNSSGPLNPHLEDTVIKQDYKS